MSTFTEEHFRESLNRYYDAIDKSYTDRSGTKKWCLTVWVACLTLSTKIENFPYCQSLSILLVAVFIFWYLDAMQAGYGKNLSDKAMKMEQILSQGFNNEINDPLQYFYITGRNTEKINKIKSTIYAMFCMETVFAFYLLLIMASFLFLGFIHNKWFQC